MSDISVIETTLLRGRVRLLQPKKGFHASLDTVFLAAAAEVREGQKLLDIGCGVGSAGFCVMAREKGISLTGIDVQRELVDLALQNAALNGVADRCRFFCGSILTDRHVEDNSFHAAMMNPPYQDGGTPSPNRIKSVAHGEGATGASLSDWIRYAHKKLKNGGRLALIHRADRMDEVVTLLTHRRWFGSLEIFPLWPHAGEPAKRVIIRARKERYAPAKLHPGLILHVKNKSYTPETEKILTDGCALPEGGTHR